MRQTIELLKAENAVLKIENEALSDKCKEYEKLLVWLEQQTSIEQQYAYENFVSEIMDTNVDDMELMEMIAEERYGD